ncbi:alpha/beta-hydrolase [Aspergillus sclerotioniger CBS 115572]|uniref:Alpha/beta-hydrolase n=1 Tax=Aspergillus sclerotioniger CBS 115572 TaxID=1450535 RepID=A0A317XBD0_9EURO|nr:alpha/beta-hydrolase [Aspergillus sclerotioniger CBS 115572]PWY94268.1 alpha/beta-hydrolase [Aspergillus sclerotioniger CBS 115572]
MSTETLISIGPYKLFYSLTPPTPLPNHSSNQPLIIIIPGMGDSHHSWIPFQRLLASTSPIPARNLLYDRAGLGQSDSPPTPSTPRTATTKAQELNLLLTTTNLPGPYILISHSYGGIIAREFLALHTPDIAGMVFVDAEMEDTSSVMNVPWETLHSLLGDMDYYAAVGLDDENVFSGDGDEWRELKAESERQRTKDMSEMEGVASEESCNILRGRRQLERKVLGERPVGVLKANLVRDYQRIYEAVVVGMGRGREREREAMRG